MSTFAYAIQLSDLNLDDIVEFGHQNNLNLADFYDDVIFNNEDDVDTFAIAIIDLEKDKLIKISTCTSEDFDAHWVMHPSDQYRKFTRITRR